MGAGYVVLLGGLEERPELIVRDWRGRRQRVGYAEKAIPDYARLGDVDDLDGGARLDGRRRQKGKHVCEERRGPA